MSTPVRGMGHVDHGCGVVEVRGRNGLERVTQIVAGRRADGPVVTGSRPLERDGAVTVARERETGSERNPDHAEEEHDTAQRNHPCHATGPPYPGISSDRSGHPDRGV